MLTALSDMGAFVFSVGRLCMVWAYELRSESNKKNMAPKGLWLSI
jgi:hypothetical protein